MVPKVVKVCVFVIRVEDGPIGPDKGCVNLSSRREPFNTEEETVFEGGRFITLLDHGVTVTSVSPRYRWKSENG